MAEKKPLVNYEGVIKELQSGDTIPAPVNITADAGNASSTYTSDQVITCGGA